MADAFLFNIIEKIIFKLGSSVVLRSWYVKGDIEKLRNTASTIKSVLLDAEEKSSDHQVKDWLEKLKDAADDADDLLDGFATETLRREVMTKEKVAEKVRIFFSKSNQIVFSIKMAHKIKKIREKLEDIDEDKERFHFVSRGPEITQVEKRRRTHSFTREEDVIGREGEKKALVELLLDTTVKENVFVIPIVGIGGLGKTTLAQLVYNDVAVKRHFELQVWACVSDDFDLKSIAEKIDGVRTNDDIDLVQERLRRRIEGKRYLIVLDDVWNESREEWLKLRTLLMDGGKGSKIVVTTRSQKVAKITATSSTLFLKGLDEDQSCKLFAQMAFENGKEPMNENLIKIGKEIVRKCAGVPLAIRSIGSLMYFKESEKDWMSFKNNDIITISEQDKSIFPILKVSYDHLPSYLKSCFAYCSLFPKDTYINRCKLIQLWMAQGFIQSSDRGRSLEDVGYEYFMDLACRCFFQNLERDEFGDIERFQMHDLIHDLAQLVAGVDCAIGTKEVDSISQRTRHLSFDFQFGSSSRVSPLLFKASKLRTFLLPCQHSFDDGLLLKMSDCKIIISSLEQLRVLDLSYSDCRRLPSCIGRLKLLRYLDLSCSKIQFFPQSFTSLQNLQTLKLYCSSVKQLPKNFWKLRSLRHLELIGCMSLTRMPDGLGQLSCLQTLSKFVLGSSSTLGTGASEMSTLNNLTGHIEITGLECLRRNPKEAKELKLMEKPNLTSLHLVWAWETIDENDSDVAEDDMILQGLQPHQNMKTLKMFHFRGAMISGWVSSLTNLVNIGIVNCTKLRHLPPLHVLPCLKVLRLQSLPSLKFIDDCDSDEHSVSISSASSSLAFFPCLKELTLDGLPNLRRWWRRLEEGAAALDLFPSLSDLSITECPYLTSMPLHPYLESYSLRNVNAKILNQSFKLSPKSANFPLSNSVIFKLKDLDLTDMHDLKSLFGILPHLTSLHNLWIGNCKELDPNNDEDGGDYRMQWKELKSLRSLVLRAIPKMLSLPQGLQFATTLRSIEILCCSGMREIPKWINNLGSSLERLDIIQCPNLKYLPEGTRYLKSLKRLFISGCPQIEA